MGLFSFFSQKPENLVAKGDHLVDEEQYAAAVRMYEKALVRHEKHPARPDDLKEIGDKIRSARTALARQHLETAETLMESRCLEDAMELIRLAETLSDDPRVTENTGRMAARIAAERDADEDDSQGEDGSSLPGPEDVMDDPSAYSEADFDESEYGQILLGALPEEEQAAYESYGRSFLRGFVALNQGDFERAADYLKMALEEHAAASPDVPSYIPLELATAYLNLGEFEKAADQIETFLEDFPLSARGYQIFCEIMWGLNDYERALGVLQACPDELTETPLMVLLTGQTLALAGRSEETIGLYEEFMSHNPGDDSIALALGNLYEKKGDMENAQKVYSQMMSVCSGCGRPPAAELKQRYADACFATGRHTVPVLELFLDLASSDPSRRKHYFECVAHIYKKLGNETQARRFEGFAAKV